MFEAGMLNGRAIFLSGGGSGLGKSMALHFARLGARMFLIGRREQPLGETCEEIRSAGGAAAFATCDVREYAAVEAAAAKAYAEFGRIDTLINNAAGNFMARTEKLNAERVQRGRRHRAAWQLSLHASIWQKVDCGEKRWKCLQHRHHLCGGELRLGICGSISMRKSRRAGYDDITRGGVGEI